MGKHKDNEMQETSIKFKFTSCPINEKFLEVQMLVDEKKEVTLIAPAKDWQDPETRNEIANVITNFWWLKKQGREN